ncbi:hypothetical protein KC338_g66 [Hortaea werneckii]|nr:hypothetical protein KC338_g66 [Hortaea werneckii]
MPPVAKMTFGSKSLVFEPDLEGGVEVKLGYLAAVQWHLRDQRQRQAQVPDQRTEVQTCCASRCTEASMGLAVESLVFVSAWADSEAETGFLSDAPDKVDFIPSSSTGPRVASNFAEQFLLVCWHDVALRNRIRALLSGVADNDTIYTTAPHSRANPFYLCVAIFIRRDFDHNRGPSLRLRCLSLGVVEHVTKHFYFQISHRLIGSITFSGVQAESIEAFDVLDGSMVSFFGVDV